ncbi:Levodione reductase [Colletotrichum aenigma]|uniref:Levodione reductase n=1 Tax=Colletotrichum aenigma TaxID=1215731 RepID=UPI0018731212|nr:Levodione reductase [Colletotrichum aenigma]KAF5525985.1 Levodione reductase [Colletotrichum aenigma]
MVDNSAKEATATSLPSQRLLGKVVLVTSAGGSIGLETSARLLQEGANLGLVNISSDDLERAVSQLKVNIPGKTIENRILTVTADVTSEKAVEQYTTKIASHFQRLDCAFLNAGVSYKSTSIFDTTEETYDRIMQVNVKSAFLGIKYTAKAMKDLGTGGSIILTSSIAGLRGTPGLIVYSSSKFALRGLALTAASELGPLGIRVNAIHPSGINTPMFKASWSPEKMEELRKGMPLGRFAETDDISVVVAFLASDDSKFMTGGFLKIDGGCVSF